jgi:predicted ATPase
MAFVATQDLGQRLAQGRMLRGWAVAMQGDTADGVAHLRQGLAADHGVGSQVLRPYFLSLLVEAYGQAGQPEAGLPVLAEALTLVATIEARWWEAELYRLKGALLLQLPSPDVPQAETCVRQALEVARGQQAKTLELRAALSLSRLWQQQGKQVEAHALLAPISGWFTEGFDTSDLQAAKALLEALT